jgi:poly-gamma-glutamate capsule biosynthesis protein CapA/YwtB (metallophosphatase superfamily)
MRHRARILAVILATLIPSWLAGANLAPNKPAGRIAFSQACANGQRLTIAAVGDLLFQHSLEKEALQPGHSYAQFWNRVAGVLAKADIAYANLEGTVADGVAFGDRLVPDPGRSADNGVYGAPDWTINFNYHPSLLKDLVASGFKVVSTGNNHAFDRGTIGVDRTIANLRLAGLAFTGTRASAVAANGYGVLTAARGMTVAWLSCTALVNRPQEPSDQILRCYDQRAQVLAEIGRLAADPTVDAVVFAPHWGLEEDTQPEDRQRELARQVVQAGAILVVGSHPHVLQPWEKLTMADGREALVIYSNGNFISGMLRPEQRRGDIALIELVKTGEHAKSSIAAAGYVATRMELAPGHRVVLDRGSPPSALPRDNQVAAHDLADWPSGCPDRG